MHPLNNADATNDFRVMTSEKCGENPNTKFRYRQRDVNEELTTGSNLNCISMGMEI
jgi:hypothetical protein